MFKTHQGVTEDAKNEVYLRPETAQGIFVNFANIQRTSRRKLPFGVCQIGKSFRNEITPGNFIFRTREFEQMELEFFCKPGTDLEWFAYWKKTCLQWLSDLGMGGRTSGCATMKRRSFPTTPTPPATSSFFSPSAGESCGASPTARFRSEGPPDHSGKSLEYFDAETGEHYLPYVIEPSLGADRVALAFLCDAYDEEQVGEGDIRTVLRLHPALAPFKACVLPLSKKLAGPACALYDGLRRHFMVDYDEAGSIGKRYRRQYEIGTPLCVTYDFDSETDQCVTVRDRDSMVQERVPIAGLEAYLRARLDF